MKKRKMKGTLAERVSLVEQCLNGSINRSQAANELHVDTATIRNWCTLYENEGPTGLMSTRKNKYYSIELKQMAVQNYLAGEGSLAQISKKYGIRDRKTLRSWVKVYNTHRNFKSESGGSNVRQTKDFSLEERVEMVLYCITNDYDYSKTAVKYQVKYSNLYQWVKRYEEKGNSGLEDRRGQRKACQSSRTPAEEAQIKIAQLEEQIKYQQIEIDLLKKYRELERRDR